MPIEKIYLEQIQQQIPFEEFEPQANHTFRTQIIAGVSAFICAAGIAYSQPGLEVADAKPRPAPSGETCAQKVSFYARQGALFGKIKPSDCKGRPEIGTNIKAIETAGRYFDYNPVGGVAVSACESSLDDDAVGQVDSRDNGLFQQHNPYWWGRLTDTRKYIRANLNPGQKPIKLPDSIFSAKSNAFVSVHMLRRGGGTTHWAPSRHCWSAKSAQVAGTQTRLRDWFALSRKK